MRSAALVRLADRVQPTIVTPPFRLRLAFWLAGKRLRDPFRGWVATQVIHPAFHRRRQLVLALAFPLVMVAGQAPSILRGQGWSVVAVAAPATLVLLAGALRGGRPNPDRRAYTLAYYGVTADGRLVEPLALPREWTRPGLVPTMMAAQALVAVTAGGFLLGQFAPGRSASTTCHGASRADVAAVAQLLTSTAADGVRLEHARTTPLGDGLYFLGAQVVDGAGRSLGAGVWRVVTAGNSLGFPADVSAANPVAETLTPDLGRISYAGPGGPPECLITP